MIRMYNKWIVKHNQNKITKYMLKVPILKPFKDVMFMISNPSPIF